MMPNRIPTPTISIILPVHNGLATLERAIRSVIDQTFAAWELLVIDDCSTDGSEAVLRYWSEQDARIRLLQTAEESGRSAARNLGIRHARGEIVCYLDQDDEYYADYLARLDQSRDESDVLIFNYDFVYEDAPPDAPVETWEPAKIRDQMFINLIAAPLGVAHRRTLVEKVGGFNELLWSNEDADLWRRFARTGAEFQFLMHKSGRFHVRANRQDHVCRLTPKQRETLEANQKADKPLFGERPRILPPRENKKIVFASPHSIVDFYNGAAIASLHSLQFLQKLGFECQAFCGSYLDAPEESLIDEQLARQQAPYEVRMAKIGDYQGRMIFTLLGGLPVTLFGSTSTQGRWRDDDEIAAFLTAFSLFLDKNRPDVMLTYGGDPISLSMIELAKHRDIPVVFALHNFQYSHATPFSLVDYAVVPSEFSRQYYWNSIGLACQHLPNVIDWQRVEVTDWQPRYVTFVNPHIVKGVYVFVRIAEILARRRPEIPLLIVEGRSRAHSLEETGLDLSGLHNLHRLEITPDPRNFYNISKLVLMPSLWNESFGLVAAEAMLNGIPVLGSNRGALPDTLGQGGFIFDIPEHYTPETRIVPPAEEVEPWVETIIRLWDDRPFFEQARQNALNEARRWHPDCIWPIYREFFNHLTLQPAPPILPKQTTSL